LLAYHLPSIENKKFQKMNEKIRKKLGKNYVRISQFKLCNRLEVGLEEMKILKKNNA